MKLKTLKDFLHCDCGICDNDITAKRIKQEAIKWYHRSDGNKHKFIKEFFNITEEEIKKESANK